MKLRLSDAVWLGVFLISAAVALVSFRYLAQVGPVSPTVAQNRFFHPWIFFHAGGAGVALLLGPLQFRPQLRQRWPVTHRWTGRAYVAACLIGGASGLVLAAGTSAGLLAQWGFAAVGVLWLFVTAQGWRTALAAKWPEHRRWMIRSFALTFAAVTLRIYLPVALSQGFSLNSAYRIIAWLSWVPNALLAEFYLRHTKAGRFRAPFGEVHKESHPTVSLTA